MTALTFFIMPKPTMLYSAALEEIVTLPAGYFVLQSDDAAPDGYIKVVYDDLTGYVKTESVKPVDFTPVTKYELTVTFRCDNDGQKVRLRAAPKKSAEVLTELQDAATGRCYGSVNGESLIADAGNKWYYVYTSGYRGYVYYAHVDVDATPPNIIEIEPPTEKPVDAKPQTVESEQNMSTTAAIIFIVALCLPVPFIMYFLFKKPKDN